MKRDIGLILGFFLTFSSVAWGQDDTGLYDVPVESTDGIPEAKSKEQTVADLESEFEQSIRDYDGMVLRERGQAIYVGNQRGAQDQVDEYDRNQPLYDEPEEKDFSEEEPQAQTAEQRTDRGEASERTEETRQGDQQRTFPPPADIPSGDDDDVVARQIREAAMREPDPELREKLWEEYRKYKNR